MPRSSAILASSTEENDRVPFTERENAPGVIPMPAAMSRWVRWGVNDVMHELMRDPMSTLPSVHGRRCVGEIPITAGCGWSCGDVVERRGGAGGGPPCLDALAARSDTAS